MTTPFIRRGIWRSQWPTLAAGTAAAPALTFTGDLDTGVFSPAADTIALTTGGTERLRVDANGNLGIGTSSPGTKLDVSVANAATATRWISATGRVRIRPYLDANNGAMLDATNTAESAYSILSLQGSTLRLLGNNGTGAVIDAAGNLGLGVTPSAWGGGFKALDFATHSFTDLGYLRNAYWDGSDYKYRTTAVASIFAAASNGSFVWFNAPSGTAGTAITFTQAMTLTAAGDLLLGQTSDALADTNRIVFGVNGSTDSIISMRAGATLRGFLWAQSTSFGILANNTPIVFSSGAAGANERARIPNLGGLVVGTAALSTTATDGFIYVPTCAGAPTGTPTTQTGTAPIVVDTTNHKLYFYSGGTWRDAGP